MDAPGPSRRALAFILHRSAATTFGNIVIVAFFLCQALDGAFTYVGVQVFGPSVEANPLLGWLIAVFGAGPALTAAKLTAAGLGIILHLASVHRAVAVLTAIYISAAVMPWTVLLLLAHGLV